MNCPHCGEKAELKSPDYGQGAEFACYSRKCGNPYGRRFVSASPEALADSDASKASSRANAEVLRQQNAGSSDKP